MIAKNNNKTTIMIVIINRFNQNVKIYIKLCRAHLLRLTDYWHADSFYGYYFTTSHGEMVIDNHIFVYKKSGNVKTKMA